MVRQLNCVLECYSKDILAVAAGAGHIDLEEQPTEATN
jgi:hypothetical protein